MARNPYLTGGDPGHPGVDGGPYSKGQQPGNQDVMPTKVDPTGTGTFPPESQGYVGRAQPAGLSAQTQYGYAAPGVVPGESPLASPMTHPLPMTADEGAIGLAPQHVTQEDLIDGKMERLQKQVDQLGEKKTALAQSQSEREDSRESESPSMARAPSGAPESGMVPEDAEPVDENEEDEDDG